MGLLFWACAGGPAFSVERVDLSCPQHKIGVTGDPKWVGKILESQPVCVKHGELVNKTRREHVELVKRMNETAKKYAAAAIAKGNDAVSQLQSAKTMLESTAREFREIAGEADKAAKKLDEGRKANGEFVKALFTRHAELKHEMEFQRRQLNQYQEGTRALFINNRDGQNTAKIEQRRQEFDKKMAAMKPLIKVVTEEYHPHARQDQSLVVKTSEILSQELKAVRDNNLAKAKQVEEQAGQIHPEALNSTAEGEKFKAAAEKGEKLPLAELKDAKPEQKGFWQSTKDSLTERFTGEKLPISKDVDERESMLREMIHGEAQEHGPDVGDSSADKSAKSIFDEKPDNTYAKQAELGGEKLKQYAETDKGTVQENMVSTMEKANAGVEAQHQRDLAKDGGYKGLAQEVSGPVAETLDAHDRDVAAASRKLAETAKYETDPIGNMQVTEDPQARAELEAKVKARNDYVAGLCKDTAKCQVLADNDVPLVRSSSSYDGASGDGDRLRNISENARPAAYSDLNTGYLQGDPYSPEAPKDDRPKLERDADALQSQHEERVTAMNRRLDDLKSEVADQKALEARQEARIAGARTTGGEISHDRIRDLLSNEKEIIASEPAIAGAVAAKSEDLETKNLTRSAFEHQANKDFAWETSSIAGGPMSAVSAYNEMKTAESTKNLLPGDVEAATIHSEAKSKFKTEVVMATGGALLTAGTGSVVVGAAKETARTLAMEGKAVSVFGGEGYSTPTRYFTKEVSEELSAAPKGISYDTLTSEPSVKYSRAPDENYHSTVTAREESYDSIGKSIPTETRAAEAEPVVPARVSAESKPVQVAEEASAPASHSARKTDPVESASIDAPAPARRPASYDYEPAPAAPPAAPVREAKVPVPAAREVAEEAPAAAPALQFPSSPSSAPAYVAHSAPVPSVTHISEAAPAQVSKAASGAGEQVAHALPSQSVLSYPTPVKTVEAPAAPVHSAALSPAPVKNAPVVHQAASAPLANTHAASVAPPSESSFFAKNVSAPAAHKSAEQSAAEQVAAFNQAHPTSVEMPASKGAPVGHAQSYEYSPLSLKSKLDEAGSSGLQEEASFAAHAESSAGLPAEKSVLHEVEGAPVPKQAVEAKAAQTEAEAAAKDTAREPAGAAKADAEPAAAKHYDHEGTEIVYWEPPKYDPEKAVLQAKNPEAKATHTNLRTSDKIQNFRRELDYPANVRGLDPEVKVRKFEELVSEKFGIDINDTVALSRNFHDEMTTDLSMGIIAHKNGYAEISKAPTGLPRAFLWGEKNLERGKLTPDFVKELQKRSATIRVVNDKGQMRVVKRTAGLNEAKVTAEKPTFTQTLKNARVDPEVAARAKAYGIEVENLRNGNAKLTYTRSPTEADLKLATDRINQVWQTEKFSPEYKAAFAHQEMAILHGFDDGNGRTGRLVSQLIYKDTTGEAAIFPKSFHREMEFSPRAMEKDFFAAQERANAKAALHPLGETEARQAGLALHPEKIGVAKDVKPPLERVANKPLPETLVLRDPEVEGIEPLVLKTKDLPPDVTSVPGNVFYGRPAKDLKELDKNLASLFSYGRQNRDGVTNDVLAHVTTTKGQANSGFFSTSTSFEKAQEFSIRDSSELAKAQIKPYGFVAVIDSKGAPGLNIEALANKLEGHPHTELLEAAKVEKEFAMTGADTRQIRGAWVNRTPTAEGALRDFEWVPNPNYDPNWVYRSPAEIAQLDKEAKEVRSLVDLEPRQNLAPSRVSGSLERSHEADEILDEIEGGKGSAKPAAQAPRKLAAVTADRPSRNVKELLGRVRENYEVRTSKLDLDATSRGKWIRDKHEIKIREDLFDTDQVAVGKGTVVHESTHMTTDLKNVLERKTTFTSETKRVYGDKKLGRYSSRVRADEVDARIKQAASLRLDRLRAEGELAKTKNPFTKRRLRAKIAEIGQAEGKVVERARQMIARERQLTEGALKQVDNPMASLPISKPKQVDGLDRFTYTFKDGAGNTHVYQDLIPQFKELDAKGASRQRQLAIYSSVKEKFGEGSAATSRFMEANAGKDGPTLTLKRDVVPAKEVRTYSVSTGIDDVQLNGFLDPAKPASRREVEQSLFKRLDQLDAREAHLEKHYGAAKKEYDFGPSGAEARSAKTRHGEHGPDEELDLIEADEAALVKGNAARPWSEELPKTKQSPYAERMSSVYKTEPMPARDPAALRDSAPKNKFLTREHSQFKAIGPQDNKNFMELAKAANAGEPTVVKRAATLQAAVGKSLNDVVIKNKDRVNQVFNLQKDLIWDKISKDELLSKHLVGEYSDFNTVKLAFDSADKQIDRKLTDIFTEYNQRYSNYLDSVAKAEGWDKKAMGLAEKRENWHHLGIGATPDEANLAARKSREMLDANGLSRPRTYEEVKGAVQDDLAAIEKRRVELENKFGETEGMFVGEKGERVLSAEASEAIRKAEQTDAGVKKALENQFSTKLTDSEVTAFRDYVSKADSFSPDLYVAERVDVPLDARRSGIVSADFKGQNARNLEETMKAMAGNRGKAVEEQVRAIRAGEENATRTLEAKKADFRQAVKEQFGKADPEWEKHVYFTGDDGIYLPAKKLAAEDKAAFASRFSDKPDNLRLTFGQSHFVDSGKAIPRDALGSQKALSDFVVDAEKVEKDLRKGLMGKFQRDVTNNTQLVVDSVPRSDGTKSIGLYLGGQHTPEQMQEIRAWTQKYLRGRGDDLSFVKALGEPKNLVADVIGASKMEPERIGQAEKILGRSIDEPQRQAIMSSHFVGEGKAGADGTAAKIGNYTKNQIAEKARILDQAGFTVAERRKLMEEGVTGNAGITVETDLATGNSKIGRAPAGAIEAKEAPAPATLAERRDAWLKQGNIEAHGDSIAPEEAVAEYKRLDSLRDPKSMPAHPDKEYYEQQRNYIRAQKNLLSSEANEKVFGGLDKALEKEFKLDEELKQTEKALKNAPDTST